MREFRPTVLMPRPIMAERWQKPEGVSVWYEGDEIRSFYDPDTSGFAKWAALADEQSGEAGSLPPLNRRLRGRI